MIRTAFIAVLALIALASNAEARQRHKTYLAHPDCNGYGPNAMPCEGVAPSPRGERVVKAMGGLGTAQKVYAPSASLIGKSPTTEKHHAKADWRSGIRQKPGRVAKPRPTAVASYGAPVTPGVAPQVVAHPVGCPSRLFCGCGAAVRVFGAPIRSLWLAANWLRFPRTSPAPGMVAARRGHVFVLEQDLGGGKWLAYDANSGRRLTRIHARSIAGYTIVNPHGSRYASAA